MLLRLAAFLLIALAAAPAHADAMARQGEDWVRITALPCSDAGVLAQIQAAGDDPADYRAANARFAGQAYAACWRPMWARRTAFLRYADGDAGLVPFAELKPIPEA